MDVSCKFYFVFEGIYVILFFRDDLYVWMCIRNIIYENELDNFLCINISSL